MCLASLPAAASFYLGGTYWKPFFVWLGYWIIRIASFFFVDTHEIIFDNSIIGLDEGGKKSRVSLYLL